MKTKFIQISVALLLCISLLISPALSRKAYASELAAERSATSTYSFTYRHVIEPDAFTDMQLIYTIGAVNFANSVYSHNFSVNLSTGGSVLTDTYTNIADCPHGNTQPCSMNGTCGNVAHHHKDIIDISNILYSEVPRDQNQIVVLWSDFENNVFCEYAYNSESGQVEHTYITSGAAAVYNHRPVILFMHLNGTPGQQDKAHMSLLLAHETAHCFALDDSYEGMDPQYKHDYEDGWKCIMDFFIVEDGAALRFYNAVKADMDRAFCDHCKPSIEDNLYTEVYLDYWCPEN